MLMSLAEEQASGGEAFLGLLGIVATLAWVVCVCVAVAEMLDDKATPGSRIAGAIAVWTLFGVPAMLYGLWSWSAR